VRFGGERKCLAAFECLDQMFRLILMIAHELVIFCHALFQEQVHPTRCKQVFVDDPEKDADVLLDELLEIAQDGMKDGTVVAIGEIGLDYDRLQFCPAEIQREYLQRQITRVAQPTGLPLFLHNRSVGDDLYKMLIDLGWENGGVVHSFDDTLELATKFIDLGLFIGMNGCSLRTKDNLQTAQSLPLERLLLETECVCYHFRRVAFFFPAALLLTLLYCQLDGRFLLSHVSPFSMLLFFLRQLSLLRSPKDPSRIPVHSNSFPGQIGKEIRTR
jgi:Tat protein secretion system quality control protein TatD with DNase activity